MKSRFRCLHKSGGALQYAPETACKIIATAAILHNIATRRGLQVAVEDTDSEEDDPGEPPQLRADRSNAEEGRRRREHITQHYF